jgi:hypothetical protein
MGDPKTSVLNQFNQCHEVKIFVDGSAFTSGGPRIPRWILALATSEYPANNCARGSYELGLAFTPGVFKHP